jgi:hypothetical protein
MARFEAFGESVAAHVTHRNGRELRVLIGQRLVRDHNGQALAYVYFEDEPGR